VNRFLRSILPVLLTLCAVVVAAFIARHMWNHYHDDPYTRDGHIRADVVEMAPDVTGFVTAVNVTDNQMVHRGDALFVIDQARYQLALQQALAAEQERRATLAQLRREASRNTQLNDVISKEIVEEGKSKVEGAEAALATASAAVGVARLNLERTTVHSPSDGFISDRAVRIGDYVTAGKAVMSVVDSHSFYVDGYFEETKLHDVRIGQKVDVHVMGEPGVLHGHVQSIAAGIEDRDRANGASLLPNVNPTFNWVRLAQRIPVRVAIDTTPPDLRLIAGRTASVNILVPVVSAR
jgi:RND family efflux transporter MFP subunit